MTEYRQLRGINQSSLKEILKTPSAYQKALEKQDDSEKNHFVLGSLLDAMVLDPPESIEEEYYVMDDDYSVSDSIKEIVRYVVDICKIKGWKTDFDNPMLDKAILTACENYNWNPRWGSEAKLKNVRKSGKTYYESLLRAGDKTIVTSVDYSKASIAKASLLQDSYIKPILKPSKEHIEIRKKVVLSFKIKNYPCKGEIDLLYIDHKKKHIVPIDLKSIGTDTKYFPSNFWKFRYDFQAAFYSEGIGLDEQFKELLEKEYTIKDFKFIVADINNTSVPLVYTAEKEVLNIGKFGGTLSNGKVLEGFLDAFDRLDFHTEKGEFTYPKEYYKGPLKIEI